MTTVENPVDLVARWMAIGSFAISAVGFLYLVLKDRRKISVKAENVDRYYEKKDLKSVLCLTVVNTGHRSIKITGFMFDFSKRNFLISGAIYKGESDGHYLMINSAAESDDLPKLIKDGESVKVFFEYDRIGHFMLSRGPDVELEAIYAFDVEYSRHKAKVPKYLKDKINSLPLEWAVPEP